MLPFILFCGGFLKALEKCFVFTIVFGKLQCKLVLRVLGHNADTSTSILDCLKVIILDIPLHCRLQHDLCLTGNLCETLDRAQAQNNCFWDRVVAVSREYLQENTQCHHKCFVFEYGYFSTH